MSRPKGSAKTPGSGRKAGSLNKATTEIKQIAREQGPAAIKLLTDVMNNSKKPDALRMAAAKELLDRGYGRPVQPTGSDPDEPITVVLKKFVFDDEPQGIESGAPAG